MARVEYYTSNSTRRKQDQYSRDLSVKRGNVERLEYDLHRPFPVQLWVER